jgi:sulfur carrier protein
MQLVLPKGKVRTTLLLVFYSLYRPFLSLLKLKRMEITVNNQPYPVFDSCSVADMLSVILQLPDTGLAVAVNQSIVSRADWSGYLLQPGDQVVLIKATQGG